VEFDQDLEAFRAQIRDWIETSCGADNRGSAQEAAAPPLETDNAICWGGRNFNFASGTQRNWTQAAAAIGMTAPSWPKAYGREGLSRAGAKIYQKERPAAGAPMPLQSFGLWIRSAALRAQARVTRTAKLYVIESVQMHGASA